jgi:hypothetical protein
MKICARCKLVKSKDQFSKNKQKKDGLCVYCKFCKSLESKKYNKDNREKCAEKLRKWREKNGEKCKKYGETHREKNHDKIIARRKTPEAREKMRLLVNNWNEKNKEKVCESRKRAKRKYTERNIARLKIMNEIRRGRMKRPQNCEICMKECKPDAHHPDYTMPLKVNWLCKICHAQKHGKLMDVIPNA